MPKKFDPDCPFCQAIRNEADFEMGRFVAKLDRSALFLKEDLREVLLVAHTHVADVAAMHEKEQEIFELDRNRAIAAAKKISTGDVAGTAENSGEHFYVRLGVGLSGDIQHGIGDLRGALGFIRQRVTDPLLKNWVDEKGRVTDWPNLKHPEEQDAIRAYLAQKFTPGRAYTEKQVTELLNEWATFGDWAVLRRELFMHGMVHRYKDGSKYWVGDEEPDWD